MPKGAGRTHEQSFKEMKHKAAGQAEQRSFEAEVAKELYRLAKAPASEYEVTITGPILAQYLDVLNHHGRTQFS